MTLSPFTADVCPSCARAVLLLPPWSPIRPSVGDVHLSWMRPWVGLGVLDSLLGPTYPSKLCRGLVSHMIVPLRANQRGLLCLDHVAYGFCVLFMDAAASVGTAEHLNRMSRTAQA